MPTPRLEFTAIGAVSRVLKRRTSMSQTTSPDRDTDLTQPGQTPGHEGEQPGQTGAPGRDVAPQPEAPATTDVPDDEASPGTPD